MTQPQLTPDSPAAGDGESFETSLAALEKIVHALEDGQQGLSKSLEQYEQGVQRLNCCYRLLAAAEQKIELLTGVNADGSPLTEPFEPSSSALEDKVGTRQRRRASKPE